MTATVQEVIASGMSSVRPILACLAYERDRVARSISDRAAADRAAALARVLGILPDALRPLLSMRWNGRTDPGTEGIVRREWNEVVVDLYVSHGRVAAQVDVRVSTNSPEPAVKFAPVWGNRRDRVRNADWWPELDTNDHDGLTPVWTVPHYAVSQDRREEYDPPGPAAYSVKPSGDIYVFPDVASALAFAKIDEQEFRPDLHADADRQTAEASARWKEWMARRPQVTREQRIVTLLCDLLEAASLMRSPGAHS